MSPNPAKEILCLTAIFPPTEEAPLTLAACTTPPSVTQQWTWVNGSLRLASDTSWGGAPSAVASNGGAYVFHRCASDGGTVCDSKLEGWHSMAPCFGTTP